MTTVMPARRWGTEPAPQAPGPTVLVSSRDGAEVPHVAGAVRLSRAATAAGWRVRQAYALAEVPATSRRGAHRLASVTVRLARADARGWASWRQVDGGAWRFDQAFLGLTPLGARDLTTRVIAP